MPLGSCVPLEKATAILRKTFVRAWQGFSTVAKRPKKRLCRDESEETLLQLPKDPMAREKRRIRNILDAYEEKAHASPESNRCS